jgi:hypothetical protein
MQKHISLFPSHLPARVSGTLYHASSIYRCELNLWAFDQRRREGGGGGREGEGGGWGGSIQYKFLVYVYSEAQKTATKMSTCKRRSILRHICCPLLHFVIRKFNKCMQNSEHNCPGSMKPWFLLQKSDNMFCPSSWQNWRCWSHRYQDTNKNLKICFDFQKCQPHVCQLHFEHLLQSWSWSFNHTSIDSCVQREMTYFEARSINVHKKLKIYKKRGTLCSPNNFVVCVCGAGGGVWNLPLLFHFVTASFETLCLSPPVRASSSEDEVKI